MAFCCHLLNINSRLNMENGSTNIIENIADMKGILQFFDHELRLRSSILNKILRGLQLSENCFGSPDVIIRLSLPFTRNLEVYNDTVHTGYINIHVSEILQELEELPGYEDVYDWLYYGSDDNDILFRSTITNHIEDTFENILVAYSNNLIINSKSGEKYAIQYTIQDLRHVITCTGKKNFMSINFISGIIFHNSNLMFDENCLPHVHSDTWCALINSSGGPKENKKYCFELCNPSTEKLLVNNKGNLITAFRLLKSLMEECEMFQFKTYFLKSVFLFEIENQKQEFWLQPVDKIFIHMLDVLRTRFEEQNLPFYWNDSVNLLHNLSEVTEDYYCELLNLRYNTLQSYIHQPRLSFKTCADYFQFK